MEKYLKFLSLFLSTAFLVMGCKPEIEEKQEYYLEASGNLNGYGYVDLGLPSGTLWAVCNVGADYPVDCGDYFAWGETQAKENYQWNTYAFSHGDYNHLTKYCDSVAWGFNGFTDGLINLLPEDDAATVNWGENWRTPTCDEWEELYWKAGLEVNRTIIDGVDGLVFTSRNGNSLFLPYAGYNMGTQCYHWGLEGMYWTNSLDTFRPFMARSYLQSTISTYYGMSMLSNRRCEGLPVRPVCNSIK